MSNLIYILGPCVIESEDFLWQVAETIYQTIPKSRDKNFYFKASYDKANRSAIDSFRGPGVIQGCKLLRQIGDKYGWKVTTDVHSVEDVKVAADYIDMLQIPAFLCRQTDLIAAAAQSGTTVNVKKGQFLAPWDVGNIIDKLEANACKKFYITERGTSFGYNNLVVDMRSLYWMKEQGVNVIFDATHSVQRPGGLGKATGGDGILAPVLARAAVAVGIDGLFIETHPYPNKALSDGPNQIPLPEMPHIINTLDNIQQLLHS